MIHSENLIVIHTVFLGTARRKVRESEREREILIVFCWSVKISLVGIQYLIFKLYITAQHIERNNKLTNCVKNTMIIYMEWFLTDFKFTKWVVLGILILLFNIKNLLFCEFDVSEEISNKHRIANRALITLSFNSTNIHELTFSVLFCWIKFATYKILYDRLQHKTLGKHLIIKLKMFRILIIGSIKWAETQWKYSLVSITRAQHALQNNSRNKTVMVVELLIQISQSQTINVCNRDL